MFSKQFGIFLLRVGILSFNVFKIIRNTEIGETFYQDCISANCTSFAEAYCCNTNDCNTPAKISAPPVNISATTVQGGTTVQGVNSGSKLLISKCSAPFIVSLGILFIKSF
jgi:hypothetical protein